MHLAGCPAVDLAPLMAVMADLSKENPRRQRNQAIVRLYGCWHFVASSEASLL